MKHIKQFESVYDINVGDCVITDLSNLLNLKNPQDSPFHNIKGVVVEKMSNDFLVDLSINGQDFIDKYKFTLYGSDIDSSIPKTCKWFEKIQLIKNEL